MTKVLNVFGPPCCGKSTTSAGLFYYMKQANVNVELVTEYAKDLVYSNQLNNMLEQQEYLFAEQNYRIQRLIGKVDWIVTDSPILLNVVYSQFNAEKCSPWPAREEFLNFVDAQFRVYNNINVFLNKLDNYQTNGRIHQLDEVKKIDELIKKVLLSYEHKEFNVTHDIVFNILNFLHQEHNLCKIDKEYKLNEFCEN